MSSIAFEYGFFWETLWGLPDNKKLKELRKTPYTLAPGDVVSVPEKRAKSESIDAGKAHRFRVKGVPEQLRLEMLDPLGEPRKGLAYVIEGSGVKFEGKLDGKGRLEHWISPELTKLKLTITVSEDEVEEYDLLMGGLDPIDSVLGAQQRLLNLGLFEGKCNGEWDDDLCDAVIDFQIANELEVTGDLDKDTVAKLEDVHGG